MVRALANSPAALERCLAWSRSLAKGGLDSKLREGLALVAAEHPSWGIPGQTASQRCTGPSGRETYSARSYPLMHKPRFSSWPGLALVLFLACIVLNPAPCHAAVVKGTHIGGFFNGANWGVGRLGRISDTGINFGLFYRYHFLAAVSGGFEVRRIDYGATTISGSDSDVEMDSYALIGRRDIRPMSDLRPYLVCGVSSNRFKRETVLNGIKTDKSSFKPGGSVGIGLDRDFGKNWTVGGQFRYLRVGSDINALGLRLLVAFRIF